jgi:hypothetical protein
MNQLLRWPMLLCLFLAFGSATSQTCWGAIVVTSTFRTRIVVASHDGGFGSGTFSDPSSSRGPYGPGTLPAFDSDFGNPPDEALALAWQTSNVPTSDALPFVITAIGGASATKSEAADGFASATSLMSVNFDVIGSPVLLSAAGLVSSSATPADNFTTLEARVALSGSISFEAISPSGGAAVPFTWNATLNPGSYTLSASARSLVQDGVTGPALADFELEFTLRQQLQEPPNVVPEPATLTAWALIGLTFGSATWRHRRKPQRPLTTP